MPSAQQPTRRRKVWDWGRKIVANRSSKSRALSPSSSSHRQDSPPNTTNAVAPSAILSASASPANVTASPPPSIRAATIPGHASGPDTGPYVHTGLEHTTTSGMYPSQLTAPPPPMSVATGTTHRTDVAQSPTAAANPTASAQMLSTAGPLQDSLQMSQTKERLQLAWHGVELLLQKVGRLLDGTPFKVPIAAINVLLEIGNAVVDNEAALQEGVARIAKRLGEVNGALLEVESDAKRAKIITFAEKLVEEAVMLKAMSSRATWKEILENEEDKRKIEESFKRIDECTKDFQLYINMNTNQNTEDIKKLQVTGLSYLVTENIKKWLSAPDSSTERKAGLDQRSEGTAEWILRNTAFKKWREWDGNNVLWLHGKSGTGKSVLCAYIVETLEGDVNGQGLAYFFFVSRGQDEKKKNLDGMLSAFLLQLATVCPERHKILCEMYDSDPRHPQPSNPSLRKYFHKMLAVRGSLKITLVIDALDEYLGDGETMFTTLSEAAGCPNIRILVTSRNEPHIRLPMEKIGAAQVDVGDSWEQQEDIRKYINGVVGGLAFSGWSNSIVDLIKEHFRDETMFRLVALQLVELKDISSADVQKTLKDLPTSLTEMYKHKLASMHKTTLRRVMHVFEIISSSSRPLTVDEVAEVLAVDFHDDGHAQVKEDVRPSDPARELLRLCTSAFIQIEKPSWWLDEPTVRFAHASVLDYLKDPTSSHYVEEKEANITLTKLCLCTISSLTSPSSPHRWGGRFKNYARKCWVQEIERVLGHGLLDRIRPMLNEVLRRDIQRIPSWDSDLMVTPLHVAAYLGLYDYAEYILEPSLHPKDDENLVRIGTPLYVASWRGHLNVVQLLVERGASLNKQDIDGKTLLHITSQNGHLSVVHLLVEHGASLDTQDCYDMTPLHVASQNGHLSVVQFLVEHRASLNMQDWCGKTLLHVASQNGHLSVVELLVEYRASLNTQDKDGKTPLHLASRNGHLSVVQLLVELGASLDMQDKNGQTPLYVASQNGHLSVVRLLVEHRASLDMQDKDGKTPLHTSSWLDDVSVAQLLVEGGASLDMQNEDGETPLHVSSQNGHLSIVQLLLECGASLDMQNKHGKTPLHVASWHGHLSIIEPLVKNGASLDTQDKHGMTPLHVASRQDHLSVVQLLVKCGASLDAQDKDSKTPLYVALQKGHLNVVQLLVGHGASLNMQNEHGETPLHIALWQGHLNIVQLLVELRASLNMQDKEGVTPLHIASQEGHFSVVQLLVERGASLNTQDRGGKTPLHVASWQGHLSIVQLLVECGASLDMQDKHGNTALHFALWQGHLNVIQLLVELRASLNMQDKEGVTPLHIASREGHLSVVQLLVERGASLNTQNKHGNTALHSAVWQGHLNVIQLLVELGASLGMRNEGGETPLHIASWQGHLSIVQLLVECGASLDTQDMHGNTTLHFALWQGHLNVIQLLVECGASLDTQDKVGKTPLHVASLNGHLSVVQLLVEHMESLDTQDRGGKTPLHDASQNGDLGIIQLLVERGASLNMQDKGGKTPLHVATQKAHLGVIQFLVEHQASLDMQDRRGKTPLHVASQNGHPISIIQLFVERGAPLDTQDKDGKTPLDIALWQGHLRVVQLLVEHGASFNTQDDETLLAFWEGVGVCNVLVQ